MLPPVGTITFELTRRCHRRCKFCYVPSLRPSNAASDDELSTDQLLRITQEITSETGCKKVQLSGGEPLLRKDILQLVAGMRSIGCSVDIITDGAFLDAPLAKALATHGVGWIQPTLLSGNPELHDGLRGKGSHLDATRAIATASVAGLRVSVCMVVTRQNYKEAGHVAEIAFALGAKGLALSRFCPVGPAASSFSDLMPSQEDLLIACNDASRACKQFGLPLAAAVTIPRCVFPSPQKPEIKTGVCSLLGPRSTVTIGANGELRSCSMSPTSVGSLRNEPFAVLQKRLWDTQLKPLRLRIPSKCVGCELYPSCLGGCRLAALASRDLFDCDPLIR